MAQLDRSPQTIRENVRGTRYIAGRFLLAGLLQFGVLLIAEAAEGAGLYDNCAPKASFFGPSLTPSFFADLQGYRIISQWTEH
jgi:hypothetical protein